MAYRTSDSFIVDKGSDNLCKELLMWSIYESFVQHDINIWYFRYGTVFDIWDGVIALVGICYVRCVGQGVEYIFGIYEIPEILCTKSWATFNF